MNKEQKNQLLTFSYLLCIYLGIHFIPFEKMTDSIWVHEVVRATFLLIEIGFIIFEMRRAKLKFASGRLAFYYALPLLIGCFTNLIYAGINIGLKASYTKVNLFSVDSFFIDMYQLLLTVFIEEVLFRGFLLNFFSSLFEGKRQQKLISILLSSLCFSLMHCVNFYGNAPSAVGLQLLYTFFLGMVLSTALYLVKGGLVLVLCGHLFFNLFNSNIYGYFFSGISLNSLAYYLIVVSVVCLIGAYFLFLYYKLTKDEEEKRYQEKRQKNKW